MLRKLGVLLVLLMLVVMPLHAQDDTDLIGPDPDSIPEDVNPLTGLPVDDPSVLDRRPLIVKISNYPPVVRPQSGLNSADIVWEHLLAGGVTRFSAFFLSEDIDHVGPIRSARLVDFQLIRIHRALVTYSGMAEGTLDRLRADPIMQTRLVGGGGPCPPLCRFEEEGLALEHTLFGDTTGLRELAEELERDTNAQPLYGLAFSETAPEGVGLEEIAVNYRQSVVSWRYDDESGRWLRFQDGEEHFDATTETQINAANVVIIEADHIEQPFVRDGYWGPPNFAFEVNLYGEGRAILLRDGVYVDGLWRRDQEFEPIYFFTADGEVLPFKPGNTFFMLVPRWVEGYQLEFTLDETLTATFNARGGANLRYGPGTGYSAPAVAYDGDEFTVIGRNDDGDWVQIRHPDSGPLWAATIVLDLDGEVMDLPLARPTIE